MNVDACDRVTFDAPVGRIVGRRDGEVVRATGIPYATANRWERPHESIRLDSPLEAFEPAPACPQNVPSQVMPQDEHERQMRSDEHCQFLSITLPGDATPDEALPVMVWIHGGSYTFGAGDWPIFDSAALVREGRVIVVSVTYRLGLFGFLGWEGGPVPNLGLLDLIEALRWIRRNILAFGGDPDNVTLFGQSAGGDAIAHLMIADGTKGLFQRAIVQSSPFGLRHGKDRMIRAMGARAKRLSRDATATDVVAAQVEVKRAARRFGLNGVMPFGVQYGVYPLPNESDVEAAWARIAPRFDVMIGFHADEVSAFLPLGHRVTRTRLGRDVEARVRSIVVSRLSRRLYQQPAVEFAARHARHGGGAYGYEITWRVPGNPFGNGHSIELPLLFDNFPLWRQWPPLEGVDKAAVDVAGQRLRGIWAAFAKDGDLPEIDDAGLIRVKRASSAIT